MTESNIKDLYSLRQICETLNRELSGDLRPSMALDAPPVILRPFTLQNLQRWAERREVNDFPEVKRRLGRYTFYSLAEVREWVVLWQRATKKVTDG